MDIVGIAALGIAMLITSHLLANFIVTLIEFLTRQNRTNDRTQSARKPNEDRENTDDYQEYLRNEVSGPGGPYDFINQFETPTYDRIMNEFEDDDPYG